MVRSKANSVLLLILNSCGNSFPTYFVLFMFTPVKLQVLHESNTLPCLHSGDCSGEDVTLHDLGGASSPILLARLAASATPALLAYASTRPILPTYQCPLLQFAVIRVHRLATRTAPGNCHRVIWFTCQEDTQNFPRGPSNGQTRPFTETASRQHTGDCSSTSPSHQC